MNKMTLLRKIDETCLFIGWGSYPEGPIRLLPISGVKARITTIENPLVNLVGMATLTAANVDESIQNIIKQYQQEEKTFSWFVGPTSQPANLGDHLIKAGFTHVEDEDMWGMTLNNLNHAIKINPDIRVEQASIADWHANLSIMVHAYGFGTTEETMAQLINLYEASGEQSKVYLAYVPDRQEPVAFSASIFDDNERMITLGGAATLEEYRGRGIYHTMVAKRLEDAQARGATCAIIQAIKGTSAPICAKLGFEIVGSIDFYAYM